MSNMSIDWSCAPAEATHYCIGDDLNPWRKIVGTTVYAFNRKKWLMWSSFNEGYMPAYYAPIPLETWGGQGLPPVGIEAEVIWDSTDVAYYRAKILAHDEDRVVFRWCEGESKGQYGSYAVMNFGILPTFRPPCTPEQIAADEREKAVQEMLALDEYPHGQDRGGMMSRADFCRVLYDAGYRRQESST
ncbi:hypothetical protein [Pseudomonas aeruginosa]|uniref:hypothetical protein n=1 Tax=Pseudomonas aeruginosa TaxID=287 RepID=UPI0011147840|nr:hypothetical protein [Pseudomonas aeruginosa]NYU58342.1 hypothetical protein [Pseudomonas aeruginosa]HBP1684324.1 hypothetical protein [Pseudomonas aeruginosa]